MRDAHECKDLVPERFYIGRLFRIETEHLEKLFALYTKLIALPGAAKSGRADEAEA